MEEEVMEEEVMMEVMVEEDGDGGAPMFDLFGDDGGGGYGQPPAERVPTTPQPRR